MTCSDCLDEMEDDEHDSSCDCDCHEDGEFEESIKLNYENAVELMFGFKLVRFFVRTFLLKQGNTKTV